MFRQKDRLITIKTPLGADVLLLKGLSGVEGISSLFNFELNLLAENQSVSFKDIIGQNATVSISLANGERRFFNGIISRFSQGEAEGTSPDPHLSYYSATLVPWLWLLTRTTDSRIFQKMSVSEIIEKIFTEKGLNDFKLSLKGTYEKRDYCVQYRETDFNFISRLMEEEGIFYFFEHADGKHTLIMADDPKEHLPCPNQETAACQVFEGATETADMIKNLRYMQEVKAGKFTLNDFNFTIPNTSLTAEMPSRIKLGPGEREYYDYPGGYSKKSEGERLANIRIQEQEAAVTVLNGSSSCRAFIPGYKFTLKDFTRSEMNDKDYVLTAVTHSASQLYSVGESGPPLKYENQFTCIPLDVPFRPLRTTPKPVIDGVQTAIVVGPKGEEIYTDEHGRVKVQFHWDREGKKDENSSCWIRVSQVWAGTGWGAMFIPRISHEVIVDFVEGDPDRPIITGRVYHANNMPPYPLPDEKTKSAIKSNSSKGGDGFNEIRFEDKKGSEQLFMHAEKNLDVRVKNDSQEFIGHDLHLIVKSEQIELVEGNKHSTVKGDRNEKVEGAISIKSDTDIHEKAGMNFALDAGQEIHLKAGMNIVLEAGAKFTIEAGGSFITIGPSGVDISGAKVNLNSGGSPVVGSGCSPQAPKLPKEADVAKPGGQPKAQSAQAQTLKSAAKSGMPFCAT